MPKWDFEETSNEISIDHSCLTGSMRVAEKSKPYAQWLNPSDSREGVHGLFIKKDEAEKAGFSGGKLWKKTKVEFSTGINEGFLSMSPYLIFLWLPCDHNHIMMEKETGDIYNDGEKQSIVSTLDWDIYNEDNGKARDNERWSIYRRSVFVIAERIGFEEPYTEVKILSSPIRLKFAKLYGENLGISFSDLRMDAKLAWEERFNVDNIGGNFSHLVSIGAVLGTSINKSKKSGKASKVLMINADESSGGVVDPNSKNGKTLTRYKKETSGWVQDNVGNPQDAQLESDFHRHQAAMLKASSNELATNLLGSEEIQEVLALFKINWGDDTKVAFIAEAIEGKNMIGARPTQDINEIANRLLIGMMEAGIPRKPKQLQVAVTVAGDEDELELPTPF